METIEKRVADVILQRSSTTLEVEGIEYAVAPPTIATLILISEIVANFPTVNEDTESITVEVLRVARDAKSIGDIAAALVLGAKRIREHRTVEIKTFAECTRFSFRKMHRVKVYREIVEEVEEKDALAELLLLNCPTSLIGDIIRQRFDDMGIADFFGITTSLSEANLLKATKEVVTQTIASGL